MPFSSTAASLQTTLKTKPDAFTSFENNETNCKFKCGRGSEAQFNVGYVLFALSVIDKTSGVTDLISDFLLLLTGTQ